MRLRLPGGASIWNVWPIGVGRRRYFRAKDSLTMATSAAPAAIVGVEVRPARIGVPIVRK